MDNPARHDLGLAGPSTRDQLEVETGVFDGGSLRARESHRQVTLQSNRSASITLLRGSVFGREIGALPEPCFEARVAGPVTVLVAFFVFLAMGVGSSRSSWRASYGIVTGVSAIVSPRSFAPRSACPDHADHARLDCACPRDPLRRPLWR
jgi:hypothetical protein